MPVPFFNVLNGGVHSGNTMAFQEIMIAPTGATSITEAVQMGAETYHALSKVIAKKFGAACKSFKIYPSSPISSNPLKQWD